MATRAGRLVDGGAGTTVPTGSQARWVFRPGRAADSGTAATPSKYLMIGQDLDCGSVTFRTWVVVGSPDFTGSGYSGARCGATPLANIAAVKL